MSQALDVVNRLIKDTLDVSSAVLDSDESYKALTGPSQSGYPSLFHKAYSQPVRVAMDMAIGQRLRTLEEVRHAIMQEEMKTLEDAERVARVLSQVEPVAGNL